MQRNLIWSPLRLYGIDEDIEIIIEIYLKNYLRLQKFVETSKFDLYKWASLSEEKQSQSKNVHPSHKSSIYFGMFFLLLKFFLFSLLLKVRND